MRRSWRWNGNPPIPTRPPAWDLYVELLTHITTQPLSDEDGVEQTALDSIHALFGLTRQTLKDHGRSSAFNLPELPSVVLNQIVRPFTAKWHRKSRQGVFGSREECKQFRLELQALQTQLRNYTGLLARLADVEDLTEIAAEDL